MLKTGDRGEDDIGNNDDIITVGISLMIVASIPESSLWRVIRDAS